MSLNPTMASDDQPTASKRAKIEKETFDIEPLRCEVERIDFGQAILEMPKNQPIVYKGKKPLVKCVGLRINNKQKYKFNEYAAGDVITVTKIATVSDDPKKEVGQYCVWGCVAEKQPRTTGLLAYVGYKRMVKMDYVQGGKPTKASDSESSSSSSDESMEEDNPGPSKRKTTDRFAAEFTLYVHSLNHPIRMQGSAFEKKETANKIKRGSYIRVDLANQGPEGTFRFLKHDVVLLEGKEKLDEQVNLYDNGQEGDTLMTENERAQAMEKIRYGACNAFPLDKEEQRTLFDSNGTTAATERLSQALALAVHSERFFRAMQQITARHVIKEKINWQPEMASPFQGTFEYVPVDNLTEKQRPKFEEDQQLHMRFRRYKMDHFRNRKYPIFENARARITKIQINTNSSTISFVLTEGGSAQLLQGRYLNSTQVSVKIVPDDPAGAVLQLFAERKLTPLLETATTNSAKHQAIRLLSGRQKENHLPISDERAQAFKWDTSHLKFIPEEDLSQQRVAVSVMEENRVLIMAHAPAGTGKSMMLCLLANEILSKVTANQKVVMCCMSNAAANNLVDIMDKLVDNPAIRMSRFFPFYKDAHQTGTVRTKTVSYHLEMLEALCKDQRPLTEDDIDFLNKYQAKIKEIDKIRISQKVLSEGYQQENLGNQLSKLLTDLKRDRDTLTEMYFDYYRPNLVICTLHQVSSQRIPPGYFQFLLMDEGAQSPELAVYRAISSLSEQMEQIVIVGDDKQLGPFAPAIKGDGKRLLTISVFSRQKRVKSVEPIALNRCYRMKAMLLEMANRLTYEGKLLSAVKDEERPNYAPIFKFPDEITKNAPLIIINIKEGKEELRVHSLKNEEEVKAAMTLSKAFVQRGNTSVKNNMFLSPYKAQVTTFQEKIAGDKMLKKTAANTVDSSQGTQRSMVILSMVRTSILQEENQKQKPQWQRGGNTKKSMKKRNKKRLASFFTDVHRLNVATTRSMDFLALLCNAAALEQFPAWAKVIAFAKDKKCYIDDGDRYIAGLEKSLQDGSAWQEDVDMDLDEAAWPPLPSGPEAPPPPTSSATPPPPTKSETPPPPPPLPPGPPPPEHNEQLYEKEWPQLPTRSLPATCSSPIHPSPLLNARKQAATAATAEAAAPMQSLTRLPPLPPLVVIRQPTLPQPEEMSENMEVTEEPLTEEQILGTGDAMDTQSPNLCNEDEVLGK